MLRHYADVMKPLVLHAYTDRSLDLVARLRPAASLPRAEVAVAGVQRLTRRDTGVNGGDRRLATSIECQESLARIVVDTRGEDSYAGRALKELEHRRATEPRKGPDAPLVYSLRGRWIVGTAREIRAEMEAEAAAACRRKSSAAARLVQEQMAAQLPPGSDAQH